MRSIHTHTLSMPTASFDIRNKQTRASHYTAGIISNHNRYQCQAPTLFNPIEHSTAVLKYRYYDTVVRCISTLLYKKKSKAQNLLPREVTGYKRPFSAYHRHQSLLPSMQKKRMATTQRTINSQLLSKYLMESLSCSHTAYNS